MSMKLHHKEWLDNLSDSGITNINASWARLTFAFPDENMSKKQAQDIIAEWEETYIPF